MQLDLGTSVDRYVVEALIGQGGVASVYRVRHSGLGTVHALKVVHVPSPSVTERLLREGRVQGRLRHPNVVSVTDLVTIRGAPGLVMEYVPGPALDSFLDGGRLSLPQADRVARGILAGVAAAHRLGLIHRDLKPGNVLVDVADDQIIPRIVDFGLAKVLEAEPASPIATRAGASLGTPAYMAPEQIDDASAVDERADVFALGAILFELVAGQRAFAGDTVPEVYRAIRTGTPRELPEGLPERMVRAITGALERDPNARISSVEALLAQWIDETPMPEVVWPPEMLRRAQVPAHAPPQPSEHTPSTSTFAGEERTTQETWAEPGALATTAPDLRSTAPRATERRARWWLAGILGSLAVAAVGTIALRPKPVAALRPDAVPTISADSSVQRQFESAWGDYLAADFVQAERRLRSVREAEPQQVLPLVLASGALMLLGDVPASLEAMSEARGRVAGGATGPGSELVQLMREIQERGDANLPRELLAFSSAHPDDYLVRLMAAQFCSTTSLTSDCELAHARLLEADAQPVVAHVCIARSWLDLGELERARAAAERGLEVEPQQPELLALVGQTWLAAGEVERASEALRLALQADPTRRGPKIALAQASLMLDDGSWDRLTAELLAPTVPASDRVDVHAEATQTLLGLGRAREALEHLEQAVAIETSEGTPLGVLTVFSQRAAIYGLQERPDLIRQLVRDQLELVASSPEIPNPVRNRYASHGPWSEGLVAAARGDRKALVVAIDRVSGVEIPQITPIEGLKRELGVMDRDAEAIRAASTFFWTDCGRNAALGGAFRRAGLVDEAAEAWSQVLQSPCRLHRPERAQRVAALVGLAELDRRAGRTEALQAKLAEVDRLWPRPDPDLPLVARIEALRSQP